MVFLRSDFLGTNMAAWLPRIVRTVLHEARRKPVTHEVVKSPLEDI